MSFLKVDLLIVKKDGNGGNGSGAIVPELYTVTSQPEKKVKKKQGFLGKIKEIFT